MQKIVYICDRCGKETQRLGQDWLLSYPGLPDQPYVQECYVLCPTCSSRALEKPETAYAWGLKFRPGSQIQLDGKGYAVAIIPPVSKPG